MFEAEGKKLIFFGFTYSDNARRVHSRFETKRNESTRKDFAQTLTMK